MVDIILTPQNFSDYLETIRTINLLYSYMAWPDNEEKRTDIIKISDANHFSILLQNASNNNETLTAEFALELFKIAQDCPPRNKEDEHDAQRVNEGLYLAGALQNALAKAHVNSIKSSLWNEENGIFKDRIGIKLKKGQSDGNIQRIWHRIRPVAHLYLARHHLFMINDKLQMPCDVESVISFISLAEAYRVIGEAHKPNNSKAPFIPPEKSIKIIIKGRKITVPEINWEKIAKG